MCKLIDRDGTDSGCCGAKKEKGGDLVNSLDNGGGGGENWTGLGCVEIMRWEFEADLSFSALHSLALFSGGAWDFPLRRIDRRGRSHNSIEHLQGVHSACSKRPVDLDLKVVF